MRNDFASGAPFGFREPRTISTDGLAMSFSPVTDLDGSVKASSTPSPDCLAARSETAAGTGGDGGTGSPGAPQPPARRNAKSEIRKPALESLQCFLAHGRTLSEFRISIFEFRILQDVAAEILILHDVHELFIDIGGVNFNVLFFEVGSLERDFVENFFKNSVQAARANVLGLLVDASGKAGHCGNGVFRKIQLQSLGFEQRGVLLDERVLRLGEDADEILFLERLQLDADRQAALKFRDQVRGLGHMKSARGDEQDVIGADHAVAR